jgi:hypothetical protein
MDLLATISFCGVVCTTGTSYRYNMGDVVWPARAWGLKTFTGRKGKENY